MSCPSIVIRPNARRTAAARGRRRSSCRPECPTSAANFPGGTSNEMSRASCGPCIAKPTSPNRTCPFGSTSAVRRPVRNFLFEVQVSKMRSNSASELSTVTWMLSSCVTGPTSASAAPDATTVPSTIRVVIWWPRTSTRPPGERAEDPHRHHDQRPTIAPGCSAPAPPRALFEPVDLRFCRPNVFTSSAPLTERSPLGSSGRQFFLGRRRGRVACCPHAAPVENSGRNAARRASTSNPVEHQRRVVPAVMLLPTRRRAYRHQPCTAPTSLLTRESTSPCASK